jgi:hypothetical protein
MISITSQDAARRAARGEISHDDPSDKHCGDRLSFGQLADR